jgi:hypothetical protein
MTKDTGIVNIHGKEYETVASRVQKFRTDKEIGRDYSIATEIVTANEKLVIMKATIKNKEDRIIATGYAEENRDSSVINKTSALENCETSAIGRALANFGMAGTEYASADEVANAISQQSTLSKPASEAQITLIRKLAKESGAPEDMIEARLAEIKTSAEASEAISKLKG